MIDGKAIVRHEKFLFLRKSTNMGNAEPVDAREKLAA